MRSGFSYIRVLKNASVIFCCAMFFQVEAQQKNETDNSAKIILLKAGKFQNSLEDNNVKLISEGAIFRVHTFEVSADSAVMFVAEKRLELYGNVLCLQKRKKFISANRGYYREESGMLSFMDEVYHYDEDGKTSGFPVPYLGFDVKD